MEGEHKYVEGLNLLKVVHSQTAKGCVCLRTCEHGHAHTSEEAEIKAFTLINPSLSIQLSAPVQGGSHGKGLP